LEDELEEFWEQNEKLSPMQRFFAALRRLVLERFPEPLVVFLDELDMLRSLPFRTDEFLAAIREGYNQRSFDPVYQRLTFCMLGVATPSELIEDSKMTPTDNTSVLIRGESGTGKELVARALHFSGRRKGQPFIVVNCAAVPSELAESLFFGHVKGAFSGANGNRKGYFEMADRGTLFLDEIGDMPLPLQAKLLRAFQDGSFQPVGSSSVKKADVRMLSATNVDLKTTIGAGDFGNDLYFRLVGYEIEPKPLRERSEDVSLFITHFLTQFAVDLKRPTPPLSEESREALLAYHYPGNIRELKSIVEPALIESGGKQIETHHLHLLNERTLTAPDARSSSEGAGKFDLPWNLDQAEAVLVKRALKKSSGNVSHAAALLGIHRTKVYRILAQED
jgi:transcriptional regulator with GAF, ATPase, and Fis domain